MFSVAQCFTTSIMLLGTLSVSAYIACFPMQVLRKNFRDLVFVCTFGEDDTSEKKVVYSDTDEDRILLMVRKFIYFTRNFA